MTTNGEHIPPIYVCMPLLCQSTMGTFTRSVCALLAEGRGRSGPAPDSDHIQKVDELGQRLRALQSEKLHVCMVDSWESTGAAWMMWDGLLQVHAA